ncbi:hypothetical protein E2C01_025283 [Portunus trituberculatus]|uniref:Uncharacterized protein n=1 Tax=Portunus trituberculatus TaxID=210409 RepID=A0A5B7ECX8_PORTR|nr:hypothetical protein [Portunus trituberculatus]
MGLFFIASSQCYLGHFVMSVMSALCKTIVVRDVRQRWVKQLSPLVDLEDDVIEEAQHCH